MISNIKVTGIRYDSTENILKRSVEESANISDEKNNIIIGKEIGDSNFSNCSIVSKPFDNININGQMLVLGPKRLPYQNIKTILTNFTKIIKDVI